MSQKFIIITTARSGSQMFCEFLDNQKNIQCEWELLQSHQEKKYMYIRNRSIQHYKKLVAILGNDPDKFVGNRNRNFIEYLQIWEDIEKSNYFGYKVFFENHIRTKRLTEKDSISYERYLEYILDNDIKIIHLTRQNMLLKYISRLTARQVKLYSSSIKDRKKYDVSVVVNYEDYKYFKSRILNEEKNVTNYLIDNNIPYYHITYEDLIGQEYILCYKNILKFLGENPDLFIDIKDTNIQLMKKTNIYPLSYKVINLNDLIKDANDANDTELLDNINEQLSKETNARS